MGSRIFLVDDDPYILNILELLLKRSGFKVAKATSANLASRCWKGAGLISSSWIG